MAKVIFLQDLWIEYYGVMQLSAILKRNGHDTEILFDDKENILKKVKKVKPDLIAYSIMSMQWNWTKSISSFLKQNDEQTSAFGLSQKSRPPVFFVFCVDYDISNVR